MSMGIKVFKSTNSITYIHISMEPEFMSFFRGWLTRQEQYLEQLVLCLRSNEQDETRLRQLINRVMLHYNEYYNAKSRAAHENIFLVISPPWFSSFEQTFLWLAGFKPCLAIRVVYNCRLELSPEQAERMERLAAETNNEERELSERLVDMEEVALSPPMLALARRGGGELNGLAHDVDTAVVRLAEAMEVLVACADNLRKKTVVKVVEILTEVQTVRFLAGMAQVQLSVRRRGQMRDAETRGATSNS